MVLFIKCSGHQLIRAFVLSNTLNLPIYSRKSTKTVKRATTLSIEHKVQQTKAENDGSLCVYVPLKRVVFKTELTEVGNMLCF